mmetsp:Transcript_9615/g.20810  ORF Transcript_9615/g.20810 Transcript_9615/m.20810 type:complete len:99 (+) Transcript_9615:282-578(+)
MGAQYDAKFGFPSKMVLMRGKPNASVLCAPQNVAATASPMDALMSTLDLKMVKRDRRDPMCSRGSMVRSAMAWENSSPNPRVKALQNAFQTMPRSTIS